MSRDTEESPGQNAGDSKDRPSSPRPSPSFGEPKLQSVSQESEGEEELAQKERRTNRSTIGRNVRRVVLSRVQKTKSKNRWMVSLGDLLTLLVCFFLFLVSVGRVQSIPSDAQEEPPKSGTTLAKSEEKESEVAGIKVLALTGDDFLKDSGNLSQQSVKRIQHAFFTKQKHVERLSVRACLSRESRVQPEVLHKRLESIFSLRRHFLDTKAPIEPIRFGFGAPECDEKNSGVFLVLEAPEGDWINLFRGERALSEFFDVRKNG